MRFFLGKGLPDIRRVEPSDMPSTACMAGTRRITQPQADRVTLAQPVAGTLPPERRRAAFVIMTLGFALQYLAGSAVLVHMVPLLAGWGLARVLLSSLAYSVPRRWRAACSTWGLQALAPLHLALISAALIPVSAAILILTAPLVPGAMIFAVIFAWAMVC